MPFEAVFEEVADTLLFDNILAFIARDFKLALDAKFPTEDLLDFAQRTLGNGFKLCSYPVCAVDPDKHGPQQSADGSWIEDAVKVQMYVAVTHTDRAELTRLATKYATAMKAVLRKAERTGDFTTGFPANSVFAFTLEFSYQYEPIGKNGTDFEKIVSFELTLKFNER